MMYDENDKITNDDLNNGQDNGQDDGAKEPQEETSGAYRMTRDELRSSDLYTGSRTNHSNDYSYYQRDNRNAYGNQGSNGDYHVQSDYASRSTQNERFGGRNVNKNRRPKRKGGFGVTVAKAACLGLVFGLTASAVMFGFSKASGISLTADKATNTESTNPSFNVNIVKTSAVNVETTDAKDVSDIVDSVMPGVVAVNTTVESTTTDWFGRQYTQEAKGAGSGVIMSEADNILYILTNYHVVEDAREVSVQFNDGTSATATVKGYDEDGDIAVLMVDMTQLSDSTKNAIGVMVMGDSDEVKVGNSAIAIGNALGYGQSVTTGVISASEREVALTDKTMTLLQTSAAINPGNSGGALLNARGEVIGINTVKYSDTTVEGMGYAIPINIALETAKGIIDGTIVPKTDETTAYLGITGGTLDEETAKNYNAPAGVYISNVAAGSAAQRAGLQGGCIITGFNGEEIETMEALQEAIAACKPGDNVTIVAQFPDRNGNYTEQTLTTIMGSKAEITGTNN